jgi:hypothetical protein
MPPLPLAAGRATAPAPRSAPAHAPSPSTPSIRWAPPPRRLPRRAAPVPPAADPADLADLRAALEAAVDAEDYQKAAKLRDELG